MHFLTLFVPSILASAVFADSLLSALACQPVTTTVTVTVTPNATVTDANGVALPTRQVTAPTCPQDNGAVYTAANGYVFVVECNTDHPGFDMGMVYTKNLTACADACANTPGCVDVSWNSSPCYLKNYLGGASLSAVHGMKLISKGGASNNVTSGSVTITSTATTASTTLSTASSTKVTTTLPVALATNDKLAGSAGSASSSSAPATSTVVAASGAVQVPDLSASAPIVSATASVDASGSILGAQVVMTAMGTGPGLCAIAGQSSFLDSIGQNYTLQCGVSLPAVADLSVTVEDTWEDCIDACTDVAGCSGVVYSRTLHTCSFKGLANLAVPYIALAASSDSDFAFLPDQVSVPFQSIGGTTASVATIFTTSAATSTTIIEATGTVAVPALTTDVGTIAEATVTVAAGTTLAVRVLIRWR